MYAYATFRAGRLWLAISGRDDAFGAASRLLMMIGLVAAAATEALSLRRAYQYHGTPRRARRFFDDGCILYRLSGSAIIPPAASLSPLVSRHASYAGPSIIITFQHTRELVLLDAQYFSILALSGARLVPTPDAMSPLQQLCY